MITRHSYRGMTWVDLEAPSRDELRAVMDEFEIAHEIEEEIVKPTPYPLFATMPGYVYLILHFPTADLKGGARNQEVDFIVGKKFLITVRYEVIGSINHLHKAFEAEELLGTKQKEDGPALVEHVVRRMYASMREEVEDVALKLDRVERDIFAGKERATVRTISEIGRVLLRFDTSLVRHAEPLGLFLDALSTPTLFGKPFAKIAGRIESERAHAEALVASFRAVAKELRETNDSLLSASQNETMKAFTAITVILLPLTLIASLFGMHTVHEPIMGMENDFWIIVGLLFIVGLITAVFLKLKKWM
jgi:magnesium transporter